MRFWAKYGLTKENLALFDAWKLMENGKTQIIFVPNISAEDDGILLEIDDEAAADRAFSRHSERMGRYMVEFGENGAVQSVIWTHDGEELPDVTEATWGRANVYDAKCLTELERLLADLQVHSGRTIPTTGGRARRRATRRLTRDELRQDLARHVTTTFSPNPAC